MACLRASLAVQVGCALVETFRVSECTKTSPFPATKLCGAACRGASRVLRRLPPWHRPARRPHAGRRGAPSPRPSRRARRRVVSTAARSTAGRSTRPRWRPRPVYAMSPGVAVRALDCCACDPTSSALVGCFIGSATKPLFCCSTNTSHQRALFASPLFFFVDERRAALHHPCCD